MSKSGNEFIARTQGTQFTLYAVMKAMGIPLTKSQEEFQEYLEKKYGKGKPNDPYVCPECRQYKPDDERVQSGMKCGQCAYGEER